MNEFTKDCAKGVGAAVLISIVSVAFICFCYGVLVFLTNLK